MERWKMILGGVSGAIGITGAGVAPLLHKTYQDSPSQSPHEPVIKVNSDGKAVRRSWGSGTTSATKFKNLGQVFAPFLIDVSKTDDEFWKKRVEALKGKSFHFGSIAWDSGSSKSTETRMEEVKTFCRDVTWNNLNLKIYRGNDWSGLWQLCGAEDSLIPEDIENWQLEKTYETNNEWNITAQEICEKLSKKTECKSFITND